MWGKDISPPKACILVLGPSALIFVPGVEQISPEVLYSLFGESLGYTNSKLTWTALALSFLNLPEWMGAKLRKCKHFQKREEGSLWKLEKLTLFSYKICSICIEYVICNCLKGAVLTTEGWHAFAMNKLKGRILCSPTPKLLCSVDLGEAVNKLLLIFGFE